MSSQIPFPLPTDRNITLDLHDNSYITIITNVEKKYLDEISDLRKEIIDLTNKFKGELEQKDIIIIQLRDQIADLYKQLELRDKTIVELNAKIEELQEQLEKYRFENAKQSARIDEQIARIDEQNLKIDEQYTRIDEQSSKINEQNANINALKNENNDNRNEIRSLKQIIKRYEYEKKDLLMKAIIQDFNTEYQLETKLQPDYADGLSELREYRNNIHCWVNKDSVKLKTYKQSVALDILSNLTDEEKDVFEYDYHLTYGLIDTIIYQIKQEFAPNLDKSDIDQRDIKWLEYKFGCFNIKL